MGNVPINQHLFNIYEYSRTIINQVNKDCPGRYEMELSIYDLICDNIIDGVLADGFSLPDEDTESSVKYAPGAFDGILIYHTRLPGLEDEALQMMAEALGTISEQNYPETDALFFELTKHYCAIHMADDIQQHVCQHIEELDSENVFNAALYLILNSQHKECVKIGLILFELFGLTGADLREIARNLSLYDEFTLYCIWNMRKWENGNQEIFELAKKVHGWGRIHAVERLAPETDEIRRWLLTEGCKNDVMNDYIALTCWNKSNAKEVLFGSPDPEEFHGLSDIMEGLLSEGPVSGISSLEDAEEILSRFISISANYDLTDDEKDVIEWARRWLNEKH